MTRLLTFIAALFILPAAAQDTLYFKNKDKVAIQLLEVNPDNLKYKRFDNQAGAIYTVLKTEVEQIILSNGKKEVFNAPATANKTIQADTTLSRATPPKPSNAADTIYFRSGKKTAVKIYEFTDTDVKYKPLTNPDGPVYKATKAEIKEVLFATGLKQTFNDSFISAPTVSGAGTPSSFQLKGMRDAKTFYKNRGGSVATGIVAFIFPPAGLVPAIICSSIPPKQHNLGYPDDNLWQNKDYRLSYSKEAHRIKRKRVWTGFGIGTLGTILLYFILSA